MFTHKLIIIGFKDIHTFKFICEIYRDGFSLTSIDNLTESMLFFEQKMSEKFTYTTRKTCRKQFVDLFSRSSSLDKRCLFAVNCP